MQKRIRALTYAEALEAKKNAEIDDKQIVDKEEEKPETDFSVSSLNNVEVLQLPSGGTIYPENSTIYFSPLTFGEMKFLSGSTMNNKETIDFFKKKVQCSFPTDELTYYDFYYITVLIKLATFGDIDYKMSFECNACGTHNTQPFSTEQLVFEEVRVPLPIRVDLREKFLTEDGTEIESIEFRPISIGRFLNMVENNSVGDDDIYMSNCIKDLSTADRIKIIKENLNGSDTQILETIDVYMFHGVQDLQFECKHRSKPTEMSEKDFKIARDNGEDVGEVCGRLHDIPFQHISEHISATDGLQRSIGKRVHFGV